MNSNQRLPKGRAIFIHTIATDSVVTARRNNTTYTGVSTGLFVDAFTGNTVVELRIDASTSTDLKRRFFASELVGSGGATWLGYHHE